MGSNTNADDLEVVLAGGVHAEPLELGHAVCGGRDLEHVGGSSGDSTGACRQGSVRENSNSSGVGKVLPGNASLSLNSSHKHDLVGYLCVQVSTGSGVVLSERPESPSGSNGTGSESVSSQRARDVASNNLRVSINRGIGLNAMEGSVREVLA